MKREVFLWSTFFICLAGAILAGVIREESVGRQPYWPYQGLTIVLGVVAATSLVLACHEARARK